MTVSVCGFKCYWTNQFQVFGKKDKLFTNFLDWF